MRSSFPLRRAALVVALILTVSACAAVPDGAYFPRPDQPDTVVISHALYRAAQAAGDEPTRYSFALIRVREVSAHAADEATFYFSEGLARLPVRYLEALVAREVAHEVLGHAGQRRILSLSMSAGFTVLGVVIPGLSLIDFVVNPLVVRAFSRDQEIAADLKAVEILRSLGHEAPRRTLAEALRAAATVNGPSGGGFLSAQPDLQDHLAALEPLEVVAEAKSAAVAPR